MTYSRGVAKPPPSGCEPVGIVEICEKLGVSRSAYDQWQHRDLGFPAARWTVGGRPAWNWPDVEAWAKETGRR